MQQQNNNQQNNNEIIENLYDEIKSSGYNLEEIVSGDVRPSEEIKEKINKLVSLDPNFYSNLLSKLVSEEFDEELAKKLWFEILEHKYRISEKLGRNVGIRVATLDYLENIKKIIKTPKIIEEEEFIKTLKLATKDPLTGLYNRRYMFDYMRQLIRKKQNFSLAFLDLDGFKKYNDKEGHQAGDIILQEFAAFLKLNFNDEDKYLAGRYGGDEFILCLVNIDKRTAQDILDKFRQEIQKQFSEIKITVSIGVCEFNSDPEKSDVKDFDELIEKADELLYRVKEFGGNKVFRLRTIHFYYYPENNYTPKEVAVVGDFNNWDRKKGQMVFDPQQKLWYRKMLIKPGVYKYKFLIDTNIWVADKNAKFFADDGFGGKCSVITVAER
ncbi:MAG: diguanylate cyclase [Elusimicrobiota bacterium]|nr:diguanylate cyclase [Endomicrobiia bacterium]MDW8165257.1 diguanylate cyclase [Elusimicrobiota bacterium]